MDLELFVPLVIDVLPLALPVSAELPVLVVRLVLLEDIPEFVPLVGLALKVVEPPPFEPVPPAVLPELVPAVPEPPAEPPPLPPPCAWAKPSAPSTARVAAMSRSPFFMSFPQLVGLANYETEAAAKAMPCRAMRAGGIGGFALRGETVPAGAWRMVVALHQDHPRPHGSA